jgi:hypothetical protein
MSGMRQEDLDWIAEESEGRRYLVCRGYWSGFGGSWDWEEERNGSSGLWTDNLTEARFEKNLRNFNVDEERGERFWIILDTHLSDWLYDHAARIGQ